MLGSTYSAAPPRRTGEAWWPASAASTSTALHLQRITATVTHPYLEIPNETRVLNTTETPTVELNRWSLLQSIYTFRHATAVQAFLDQHRDLIVLLLEARVIITQYFGDVPVTLDILIDPEADDEHLMAAISVTTSAADAAHQLALLDEHWWIDAVPRAGGHLCIDVDYA